MSPAVIADLVLHSQGFISKMILLFLSSVILPAPANTQELTSTLHSTFHGVKFAYDGENMTFTCETTGSNIIAWSSDQYIGSDGSRLEFIAIDSKGTTHHAGLTTATLVSALNESGQIILKSQLRISVRSAFQVSSITCYNVGSGTNNTISFLTAGNAFVTCNKQAACPGDTVMCTCTTGYSNIIAWSSDQLLRQDGVRLEFASVQPLLTRQNVSGSSAFAVLTGSSNSSGVSVLESELTFTMSSTSGNPTDIVVKCLNIDHQNSDFFIIPMSRTCERDFISTSSTFTTDQTESTTESQSSGTDTVVIICITLILALGITLVVLGIVSAAVLLYLKRKKEQQIKGLERVNMEMERELRIRLKEREQTTEQTTDVKAMVERLMKEVQNTRHINRA